MTIVGLSLLIASFSFLCYKHPPTSWTFLGWLLRPSVQGTARSDAPAVTINNEKQIDRRNEPQKDIPAIKKDEEDRKAMPPPPFITKQDQDRKAMPPPPLFKKPSTTSSTASSPTTPKAPVPTFTLSDSPPSFPALNSAQRASGGTRPAPPSFTRSPSPPPQFPAANSAQRASGGVRGLPRLNAMPAQSSGAGLMAPSARGPLPNRGPPSGLAPPPTHTSIPAKPRRKVLLEPGHSPLDWARISSSPTSNLRGLPAGTPYLRVPPSLLKTMNGRKGKDAWTVLGGKVYNISPYAKYHPGGEGELLRCAGKEGTRLFGEVHPWVNFEGMLEGCLVGIAVEEGDVRAVNALEEMD